MSNYSKALRGLSVRSRVMCIFTHTTISPGPLLRQCPSRYAIRAGRNLPDKEFRYLRTVIVTAAVHRGLSSVLRSRLLTLPLNLPALGRASARIRRISTSHRPVFLVNSRLGLFSAASLEAPLLPKLRGHFAEFLNKGSTARLRILSSPTCVGLRYGRLFAP